MGAEGTAVDCKGDVGARTGNYTSFYSSVYYQHVSKQLFKSGMVLYCSNLLCRVFYLINYIVGLHKTFSVSCSDGRLPSEINLGLKNLKKICNCLRKKLQDQIKTEKDAKTLL